MARGWKHILALCLAVLMLFGAALGEGTPDEIISENVEAVVAEAGEYLLAAGEDDLPEGLMGEIPEEEAPDEPPDEAEAPEDYMDLEAEDGDGDEDSDWAEMLQAQVAPEGFASACTIGVDQVFALVVPAAGAEFKSSNSKIAAVNSAGEVKGVKAGKATVTASVPGYGSMSCKVTVKKAPTKVTLSKSEITLALDQTYQLTGKLAPKGSATALEFRSSDEGVAKVSATGLITPIGTGEAVIGVRTHNGRTATCAVTVRPAPLAISLEKDEINLNLKGTCSLKGTMDPANAYAQLSFTSSNPGVASVSSGGKITAKAAGRTVITVATHNGLSAACAVTVWKAPSAVALNVNKATIAVGEQLRLEYAVPEGANPEVKWSSSKASVAAVSDGVVTGIKPGKATVTVATANGKKAKCAIVVQEGAAALEVAVKKATLEPGETTLVKASRGPVHWSVDGDAVVVDDEGNVTAMSVGQAVVWATAVDGAMAGCTITVTQTEPDTSKAIIDISKWNGSINFDKLKPKVSLVIARATCGMSVDVKFDSYAGAMNARNIPFGVYCYSKATNAAEAREEARLLVKTASAYKPRFYVLDAEYNTLNQACLKAFAEELRKQGAGKIGCYIAHNYYEKFGYAKVKSLFDFTWIPRYGKNDGTLKNSTKPSYPCDLWQYTSNGKIDGISGAVDMNVITGQGKSLKYLIG